MIYLRLTYIAVNFLLNWFLTQLKSTFRAEMCIRFMILLDTAANEYIYIILSSWGGGAFFPVEGGGFQ